MNRKKYLKLVGLGMALAFLALAVGNQGEVGWAQADPGSLKWKFKTGFDVDSSPAIGLDGTIYVGSGDYYLLKGVYQVRQLGLSDQRKEEK